MIIVDLLNAALPAVVIFIGVAIMLLGLYAKRMRKRFDSMTDHETLFVGDCPHMNSFGTPARRQGMAVDPDSGEIKAHSQNSISLIKAVS